MRPVLGEGKKPSRIMFLGERPGKLELYKGRPFVGPAGEYFNVLLDKAMGTGLKRKDVYVTNLLKWLPTGRNDKGELVTSDADIERWGPATIKEIEGVKPDVIVSMGAVPTRWLLGENLRHDIGTVHAIPHTINNWVKNVTGKPVTVFPTFNPAAGLHDPDNYQFVWHDFRTLGLLLKGKLDTSGRVNKYDSPVRMLINAEGLERRLKDRPLRISVDTEGNRKKPWGLSISWEDGLGYVVRDPDAYAILGDYIAQWEPDLIMHYAVHDIPVLRAMGIETVYPNIKIWDTMILAYLLQVEPQGLKALCYRHCGMEMKDYLDLVTPYNLDKQLPWLLEVDGVDWGKPEPVIERNKTGAKVRQPQGLNRRINGILTDVAAGKDVDVYARWHKIDEAVRIPAENKYGPLPVADLDDVPIDEAVNYSGEDADGTFRLFPKLLELVRELDLEEILELDTAVVPLVEEMERTGFKVDIAYMKEFKKQLRADQGKIRHELRKRIGYSINPESGPQVSELFFNKVEDGGLGLAATKFTKTGMASTQQKAIEMLRGDNEVVNLVLDHRELNKGETSFVTQAIERAEVGDERCGLGRAGGKINYTRVVSGRFSMVDLNLLAIPVRSDFGKKIRNGYVAGDGYLLGSYDLNQIEMRFMAHESEDENLIRAYLEGRDLHRETAADIFGVKPDLVTDSQRYGAKRTGFGVITGITGAGLLDQFHLEGIMEYDEDDCNKFVKGWLRRNKGVDHYLHKCRAEARRNGYVRESVCGRIRYLPAVFSPDRKIRTEAERQSHSHKISSGAQSIMKLIMVRLRPIIDKIRQEEPDSIRWVLQIHDELVFEARPELAPVLDPIIKRVMATTVKLKVPVKGEGHWAERWGQLK